MNNTIGVCGNYSTGSSAVSDLLHEFEDAQVLDPAEFTLAYYPDGLEDLEYHLKNYHKYMSSAVAINRFRKLTGWQGRNCISKKEIKQITENFLNKIIQISWKGHGYVDVLIRPSGEIFIKRSIFKIARILHFNKLCKLYSVLFPHKLELSIMPESFDLASRVFISEVLDAMGRKPDMATVLDQPFEGCNPVKSFKYFENPRAIIVDRDPRDLYLYVKCFLRPRGPEGYQVPCDNVEIFIEYYRLVHKNPLNIKTRDDLMFINFEDLVYDYENSIKKISDFAGVSKHLYKGIYFKPAHSRTNTQLHKKYHQLDADIVKIERELTEYLYPFDNYPDIESEGKMFWGNQKSKER
jgi:hypothetical protein